MDPTRAEPLTVALPGPFGPEPRALRARPDATVGDLLAVVGQRATVEGRAVAPATRLVDARLVEGASVGGPVVAPAVAGDLEVRWVTGPDAGGCVPLGDLPLLVGRAAEVAADDPHLPPFAAIVAAAGAQVRVVPLARGSSAHLVVPGDVVALGAGHLAVAPRLVEPVAAGGPAGPWRRTLVRPPRGPLPGAAPAPPVVPLEPQAPARDPIAIAPIAAAAASGLVLAAVTGRPLLALVGMVGALAAAAASLGRRSWLAVRHRRAMAAWADEVRAAAVSLADLAVQAARRQRLDVADAAVAVARCRAGSSRLWERRPAHADAATVVVGLGDVPWETAPGTVLPMAPVSVRLGPGDVLGVVGPPGVARGVARSLLVQVVAAHGPADVAVAVVGDPAAWAWTRWLPHEVVHGGPVATPPPGGWTVAVLDAVAGATVPEGAGAVVLADRPEALVAACTRLLDLRGRPTLDGVPLVPAGLAVATAADAARALARFVDPDLDTARLPDAVGLEEVAGPFEPALLAARWQTSDGVPRAVLGQAAGGPVVLDLDGDGPHVLVAGTTGAGKSELLRTLVAGLALANGPDDLTLLLVDFKGGSAFDACAALPHVVGLVTDLDGPLASRVLRSLEAELRRRERVLRAAGAADVLEHRAGRPSEPLPRLVVVVDELANLVAEVPGFVPSLVHLAQRGRSLGVHLVLATQRPRGVVSDDVRANTALRICLRTTDRDEAADVVGDARPATFRPERPGRAVVRRAAGLVDVVQVAQASAAAAPLGAPVVDADTPVDDAGPSQLCAAVDACVRAARLVGARPPRRPWLPPLPAVVRVDEVRAGAMALMDDPDAQTQPATAWRPSEGHLVVCGAAGSGTSSALLAVAHGLVATAEEVHLYAVDADSALGPLAALAQAGDVVQVADRSRVARLVRMLRARPRADPPVVLLVDGLDVVRAAFDDVAGLPVLDDLQAILAEGAARGVHVAATVRRPGALPASWQAAFSERWLLRLADATDAQVWGVPAGAVGGPPGRAVVVRSATGDGSPVCSAQVVHVGPLDLSRLAALAPCQPPEAVGALPARVASAGRPAVGGGGRLVLPLGVADDDLGPASLVLHEGDHVLVAGPPGSGRTSALRLLVHQVRQARPGLAVVVVGAADPRLAALADTTLAEVGGPALVVVDDAERVDDDGRLVALAGHPDVRLLVATRADALRGLHGHWTQAVRRRRTGLLLAPQRDDGDLLGVVLPRRPWTTWVPGRGELVEAGHPRLVQLAQPPSPRAAQAKAKASPARRVPAHPVPAVR